MGDWRYQPMGQGEADAYACAITLVDRAAAHVRFCEVPAQGGWWVSVRYGPGRYIVLRTPDMCHRHLRAVLGRVVRAAQNAPYAARGDQGDG